MARKKNPNMGNMKVTVSQRVMRFVGDFSQEITTEIGALIRSKEPHVNEWCDVSNNRKEEILDELKMYFDFGDEPHHYEVLHNQMKKLYQSWRYRLKEKYDQCMTEEELIAACSKEVALHEWLLCIERFKSEDFKDESVDQYALWYNAQLKEEEMGG